MYRMNKPFSKKDCDQIMAYLDDIIDKRAKKDVCGMFSEHINECEKCRKKYEIALKIKELLRDETPKLDEGFTASVMEKVRTMPKVKKKTALFVRFRPLYLAAAAFAVVIIGAVVLFTSGALGNRDEGDPFVRTSHDYKTDGTKVSDKDSAEYINNQFMDSIDTSDQYKNYSGYSKDLMLDVLKAMSFDFAYEDYRYIACITVKNQDVLNADANIQYIPKSKRGDVSFYKTSLTENELISVLGDSLEEELILSGGDSSQALIMVKSK